MDKGIYGDRNTLHLEQGIHFHVSLTPTEFKYIRDSLEKSFPNMIEKIAVVSHRKYYYDEEAVIKDVADDLYDFLTQKSRKMRLESVSEIVYDQKYPNMTYAFFRDSDLDFGSLEISWKSDFKISKSLEKIKSVLGNIFYELKDQVFDLYFESLYPLLMSRIHNLEQEIIEKEKSELAVDLIEGIAHSIANPLSIIFANLEITEEILTKNPTAIFNKETNSYNVEIEREEFEELRSIFEDQKEAVRRITNVISELRIFSRAYKGEIENVDLNQVIKLSLNFSQLRLKLRDRIVLKLNASARVYASLFIVSQVVYNILKILIKASPNNLEKINITTEDKGKDFPPVVSIECNTLADKINFAQFSFIENFMQNIPHEAEIDIQKEKIRINISFNTYSYLS